MTFSAVVQTGLYLVALLACVKPLGRYMARVYVGNPTFLDRFLGPLERLLYRLGGIDRSREMTARQYATALLTFSLVSFAAVYALQRFQDVLPCNPEALPAVSSDSSFNTAVSFVTNTNWQGYSGESTLSHLTQMLALTVQNFVSAAAGMAVLVALMRGFTRCAAATIGNFWIDLVRGTLYILLPLSLILAVVLISQGVVQTLSPYGEVALLEQTRDAGGQPVTTQRMAVGPAASQIAIKQLGTNGGGFFNVNSAHPFENPTPLSNGDVAHAVGRSRLWRRWFRPLRDACVCDCRSVYRRTHGRTDTGISRQEDRGVRDEDGCARDPAPVRDGTVGDRRGGRRDARALRDLESGTARLE